MSEKFFIYNKNGDIQLIMRSEDEGNLMMFGLTCEDKADADMLVLELQDVCDYLNYQHHMIEKFFNKKQDIRGV